MNLLNISVTLILSLFFSMILVAKIQVGIVLSLVILFLPIFWILSKQLDEKKFIRIFFIVYPLLPFLAGINLGAGVPVLRPHRVAVLLLLFFLTSKGLLIRCYSDFLKSNIFTFNIILILVSMAVTSIFSDSIQGTLFFTLSLILEFYIFTVVVFSIFKTEEDINHLLNSIMISCIILCTLGLFEKISAYNFYAEFGVFDNQYSHSLTHQMREGGIRIKASFDHSISYSAYIVMLLPLFLHKYRNNFILFNLFVLLIMSALFASQSRAGMLGAGIIFILYFIFIERKNMSLLIVLSIPIILYKASDIALFFINLNPFTTTSTEMADSTAARGEQLLILIEFIKQNIVFGYGLIPIQLRSVDNFYLLYIFQFGIVGLISYVALIFTIIIKTFKIIFKKFSENDILLFLTFSIIVFFIINAVVALWTYHYIFYAYIGIIARLTINRINETEN